MDYELQADLAEAAPQITERAEAFFVDYLAATGETAAFTRAVHAHDLSAGRIGRLLCLTAKPAQPTP